MSDPLTKDEFIEVVERMLAAQLRALRAGRRRKTDAVRERKKKSNIAIVEDILRSAGGPLHINEIIARARKNHRVQLKRESIVSALTKKVLDGQTFRRVGPNVFDLLERKEKTS